VKFCPTACGRVTGATLIARMTAPRRPLPRIYDQILIIGGGSPPTEGHPIAEIGGAWYAPEYGFAYLLAARYVIEGGHSDKRQNEVALPGVYLQRHALEIALKDLIETTRGINAGGAWQTLLKVGPQRAQALGA
jgi:hypothetical protein